MDESWLNLDGLKIRYLESGKEKDSQILFIHGLGSSSDRWMKIPENLSSDFHTIALDLPGFGESDKPSDVEYTIEQFRKFIISFLNKVSDKKTTVIGHSLGGYIASEIAIQNPKLVNQLVLIDSSGMLDSPTSILEQYLNAAMNPTPDNVRRAFEQMVADPSRVPSALVDGFIRRINMPNAKYAFESTLQNSATTQIGLDRLRSIKDIQTLILWGVHDKVIPLEHSKLFQDTIPNSQLKIIEDAGHAPFAEKPVQVSKILKNFLE
ncbi:MAG: alpha/beta hydrolase [Nitrosopumilus sp.]|nr:alpha/beta hydrolase [Nitrosopumilus sp.]MDH3385008.1 alpha/beta hydrolase [Nitrosopumilus sp.]